ncbi:ATP phosphoribosyltransferase regulatory subunit [Thermaurantiacus sp.]
MLRPALLPEGFRDRLPPEAEAVATLLRTVLDTVAAHGYARVQPPLAEREAELGRFVDMPSTTRLFRVVDPLTGDGLALRPDITAQVARIAATRLAGQPRPLRLAYGGATVRARGSELDPARERTQAGAELIGDDGIEAAVEVIRVAVEALRACGLEDVTVELALPDLVGRLAAGPWPVADPAAVARALDGKDRGALAGLGASAYAALLDATGPADEALARLRELSPADPVADLVERAGELCAALGLAAVRIDPTERHGFEYQSWLGFSLFGAAAGTPLRQEVGRGGTYGIRHGDGSREPAVGFSLYVDPLAEAGLGVSLRRRVFLPLGTPPEVGARLRAAGDATVAALSPLDTAERLGCTHRWNGREVAG